MEYFRMLIDFVLHIDKHLFEIVKEYDNWTYLILFLIVFCETGLVVTPFLPGDSLLFAAGALAAAGSLSIPVLFVVILAATFLGDNSNYFIGRFLGHKIYEKDYKLIKRKYIDRTHQFYEKHGGKTVIIARFIPIIRTFAPFVAGAGTMRYPRFISFSAVGTLLWVSTFCFAGYFFANNDFVKQHFSIVVLALIIIPGLPALYAFTSEIVKSLLKKKDQETK
ncbi:MAG: DedA family protein [Bacteroidales bacterium]